MATAIKNKKPGKKVAKASAPDIAAAIGVEVDPNNLKPVTLANWRELTPHPFATMFPPLAESDLESLTEDIRRSGMLMPIVLAKADTPLGYAILDGRNRHQGLLNLGDDAPEPRFVEITDTGDGALFGNVLSLNVRRRQLNRSQAACVGVKIKGLLEAERAAKGEGADAMVGDTRDLVGTLVGVSGRYIDMAGKLLKDAPDLFERVESGELGVTQAITELRDRDETAKRDENPEGNVQGGLQSEPTYDFDFNSTALAADLERVLASGVRALTRRSVSSRLVLLLFFMETHGFDRAAFDAWLKKRKVL